MRKLAKGARIAAFVIVLLQGIVLLQPAAYAQVYKWVDAAGQTHYGEKPPENVKSREVQIHNASTTGGGDAAPGNASLQEREQAFKRRQAAREQAEAKEAKESAAMEERCKAAKRNLATLNQVGRVAETNDAGERVYLNDDQRAALLAAKQQDVDQNCR